MAAHIPHPGATAPRTHKRPRPAARLLRADVRIAFASKTLLAIAAWMAATAALYLFAGQGAWAFIPVSDQAAVGFLPDPAYATAATRCSTEEAVAAACLAHAALAPVAAIAITYLLLRESFANGSAIIGFARGVNETAWLASKLAVNCALTLVPFAVMTLVCASALCADTGVSPESVAAVLLPKFGQACLIVASYDALCLAGFLALGTGPAAAGILLAATVAGFVAQMASPTAFLPTHLGSLAIAAGIGPAHPATLPFALAALATALAIARLALRHRTQA